MSTSLRVPGGMSATAATTCLPISRTGRAPWHFRHKSRFGAPRSGSAAVPATGHVRIIAGEQDLVPADPFHDLDHMVGILRFLHRLGRDPEMFAQILRWRPTQIGDFVLHMLPILVQSPAEG